MKITRVLVLSGAVLLLAAGCATADRSVTVEAGPAPVEAVPTAAAGAALLEEAAEATTALTTGSFSSTATFGGSETLTIEGSFDTERPAFRAEASGSGMAEGLAVTTVGEVIYVKSGDSLDLFDAPTPWISLDLGSVGGGEGFDVDDLGPIELDPTTFVDLLREVAGEVTTVGTEDVRGVSTTHLRAVLDVGEVAADAADRFGEALPEDLEGVLDGEVPIDVWVDADGLIRRMTTEVEAGADGAIAISFELFDLGEPVAIAAPAPDQVTPLSEVFDLGDLLGGN